MDEETAACNSVYSCEVQPTEVGLTCMRGLAASLSVLI